MKCLNLFSGENKNISKFCLLIFLSNMLSIMKKEKKMNITFDNCYTYCLSGALNLLSLCFSVMRTIFVADESLYGILSEQKTRKTRRKEGPVHVEDQTRRRERKQTKTVMVCLMLLLPCNNNLAYDI